MALHVLLVGKCTHSPPTRECLLRKLRQYSPRGYHATRSYLWTEDNLFTSLNPVHISGVNLQRYCYYAFKADMSVGGNNDDIRVAVMILLDLTSAVDDLVAVVTEGDNFEAKESDEENEETNVLLIELADVLEKSEESRSAYLKRWGVEEYNYHRTMVRRVMLAAGGVYAFPLQFQCLFSTQIGDIALPLAFLAMDAEAREQYHEIVVTEALHVWADEVTRVMREESWHLTVVAVPASVAKVVHMYPQLLHAALLHHTVQRPLTWLENGKQISTLSGHTDGIVHNAIQEYRTLIHNRRYVRMPLRMPRYIFAHFFHAGLPPSLRTEPLGRVPSSCMSSALEKDLETEAEADEEELLLGLQFTIALHRLRCEVKGAHSTAIEQFLKEVHLGGEAGAVGANESNDVFSQVELTRLQRKIMPVVSMRGDSIDWMRAYAKEAAIDYSVTENELARLEEVMMDQTESETVSNEEEESYTNSGTSVNGDDDDGDGDVSWQLEKMELPMETRMCEALLGGCESDETALSKVTDNVLFLKTMQMLARDDMLGK